MYVYFATVLADLINRLCTGVEGTIRIKCRRAEATWALFVF